MKRVKEIEMEIQELKRIRAIFWILAAAVIIFCSSAYYGLLFGMGIEYNVFASSFFAAFGLAAIAGFYYVAGEFEAEYHEKLEELQEDLTRAVMKASERM